jgi:hypothetical protein
VSFGYEREIDVSVLERRTEGSATAEAGWSTDTVLFRSGQAALACILQFAITHWGRDGALSVVHAGSYFETASLLKAWPQRVLLQLPKPSASVPTDLVLAEPVWCDGLFACTDRPPAASRALILDTTLSGPDYDLGPVLRETQCPIVIAYRSGLKIDQAGLELANVGIVQVHRRGDVATISNGLREIRGLVGAGLTLDEMSALSAPWFMEGAYARRYVRAIMAHNRALAQAIGKESPVFAAPCHPSLCDDGGEAPFCALVLRKPSIEAYRALEKHIEHECRRRGLVMTKGGSFGFRGHRFELIEPAPGQGQPFLRVALGWRDGWSRIGLCDLFAELAHPVTADRTAASASST